MLEFSKTILAKVSFDRYLFNKELRKLILWIGNDVDEVDSLEKWCQDNFGNQYPDIIDFEFNKKRLAD